MKRISADALAQSKVCLDEAQKKFVEDPVTIRQWPMIEMLDFARARDTHEYFVKRYDTIKGKRDYYERKRKQLLSALHAKNRTKGALISGRGEKLADLRKLAEDAAVSSAPAGSGASTANKVTVVNTFTPSACPPVPGSNGLLPFLSPPSSGGFPVPNPCFPTNHVRTPFNSPPPNYFPSMFPYLQSFAAASAAASPASAVSSPTPATEVSKDTETEENQEENVAIDVSSPSSTLHTPQHDSEK